MPYLTNRCQFLSYFKLLIKCVNQTYVPIKRFGSYLRFNRFIDNAGNSEWKTSDSEGGGGIHIKTIIGIYFKIEYLWVKLTYAFPTNAILLTFPTNDRKIEFWTP